MTEEAVGGCDVDETLPEDEFRIVHNLAVLDTLYVLSTLDLRQDAVVIHYPAFNSKFVSLETSALDHYVEIPLATSKGDFKKPTSILYYSARTKGYTGEPVEGVDKIMEMSGDYAIAFLRVMPSISSCASTYPT